MSVSSRSRGRALARRAVDTTVGMLPFFECRLRAVRAPQTLRALVSEAREVRRLDPGPGRRPAASVAIIVPTYRRPEQVGEVVTSALAQTVTDHVVVVVDDGAGLGPLPDDPRVVGVSLSANSGNVGVVRNVGIAISESEHVAFLDDDNLWEPDHLERALEPLARGADVVYTGVRRVSTAGDTIDVLAEPFDRDRLRERSFVDASTIVARRTPRLRFSRVPRRYGDFPREDWELMWRLSRRGAVAHVPDVTVRYLVHEASHYTDW